MTSKGKLAALSFVFASVALSSCYDVHQKADAENLKGEDAGIEYAPQMYHSEAYDPMSQVEGKEDGLGYWPWEPVGGGVSDFADMYEGHGEWYNSNYYNPYGMNMRQPVKGTIQRGFMPYELGPADYDKANLLLPGFVIEKELVVSEEGDSSMQKTDLGLEQYDEAQTLYLRFCEHCHGETGKGDGLVGVKFTGVPNYARKDLAEKNEGYIFHVITYGKGNMRPHAAQLYSEERWKIAAYVKELQEEALANK